jgi:hypothetical protein
MKRVIHSLVIGSLVLLSCLTSRADQMIPLPIDKLSARAGLVLHGTVTSTTVRRDLAGRIYTAVDLRVEEVWKGSLTTNHFIVVHGGGVLGEEASVVSGEAEYAVGEELVCFLVLNQRGEGVSIGLSQGKFNVWKDPATGEKLAHNRFHGLHPSAVGTSPSTVPGLAAPIIDRLTLADLKQKAVGGAK